MKKTLFVLGLMLVSGISHAGVVSCTSPGDALNSLILNTRTGAQTITITFADDTMADKVYQANEVFPDVSGVRIYTGTGDKSFAYGGGVSDAVILVLDRRASGVDGSFSGRLAATGHVIELICREQ